METANMNCNYPDENQETQLPTLQEYADSHCNGDRFLAIYQLMLTSGEAGFDPYVDELTQEDANFVVCLLTMDMYRLYGKKGTYQMIKTNQLAASLGTTTEEVEARKGNPYTKGFLVGLGLLAGAVGLSVLLACLPIADESLAEIGASVAIGLASMNLASKIIPFLRYSKLKRKVAKLPQINPDAAAKAEPDSFEDAMAFYREHMQ